MATERKIKPPPPLYSIDGWMVAWNPAHMATWTAEDRERRVPGAVKVGPWPIPKADAYTERDWTHSSVFLMNTGCCELARQKFSLEAKVMMMFIDFHTLVVRDGIDPAAAHREFLKIDEYRRRISPDIPGADPE
jgi:hypothetical protein